MEVLLISSALFLSLCSCHGKPPTYEVFQPASRAVNPDGTVSITCEHTDTGVISDMDCRLNKIPKPGHSSSGPGTICHFGEVKPNCTWLKEGHTQYKFTLHNVGPEAMTWLYQCEFHNTSARPVREEKGLTPTILIPGQPPAGGASGSGCPTSPAPSSAPAPDPCPFAGDLLTWLLIGASAFLLLYSLIITFVYVKLRVARSEELYDSLTYTPMQPSQAQLMRSRGDVENNATYVDMRRGLAGGRVSRTQNHSAG